LATDHILIVGAGGLGVPAASALAHAGIRRFGLIDPDSLELSNLARQVIYGAADLGAAKVAAAAQRLTQACPGLEVETYRFALDAGNAAGMVAKYGFIIDATDNPATKFLINDTCVAMGRPFVYGGVLGLTGQAMTVIPGQTACLRCLFEEEPDEAEVASCREAGIIGAVAGAIGEIEAAEAIRWSRGERPRLAGMMLTYDGAETGRIRVARVAARPECGCCRFAAGAGRPAEARAPRGGPVGVPRN
jgi:molybdopterin-synthase adenylyltransferase